MPQTGTTTIAFRTISAGVSLCAALLIGGAALAQTKGGVLKVHHRDSPPSASIHEEATISTVVPFMPVMSNLVLFKQDRKQNSIDHLEPDLATDWSWSDDKTKLTMKLRQGVKWHDGKPFTANDVKCTWDMLTETSKVKLRKNPRESWYKNLAQVTVKGDHEVVFELKRQQPSFIAFLATGYSPVYPCHVAPNVMRSKPIGTGPFKVVEFKQNDYIKLVRNPEYWKKDRPYLDGIDFTIVKNRSTAVLAFVAGEFDMTFPSDFTPPIVKDLKTQAPKAICDVHPTNVSTNLIVNRDAPPFDNAEIRRAMVLTLDRKSFNDIVYDGQATIGAAMLPPPEGLWGMPPDVMKSVAGYDPDVKKNREEARAIMKKLGYGPDNRLKVKVGTRNIAIYRDPAVILIDQLKEIYMDAELDAVETATWHTKVGRKDYQVGLNLTGNAIDDPDQNFYENYSCDSERNYTKYCNKEMETLFEQQSQMTDVEKRKKAVWEIDKKLQEDAARPIIFHNTGATCLQPQVKGLTIMVNSIYNGWRFDEVWLEK
jgi:peptide/nickel transport system substrate-binding protein